MSKPPRVLLVDDDPILTQTLAEHLAGAGFGVTVATSTADAMATAEGHDLMVASNSLPQAGCLAGDGRPPLLALGGPVAGATAWVAKPLRLNVLIAKICELAASAHPVAFGPWRLDRNARLLEDSDGRKVRLTDKETAILGLLAADGDIVGRDRLLAEVWGYSAAVATHTLETHIYRLRRKIEPDAETPRYLVTEPGGYRLMS